MSGGLPGMWRWGGEGGITKDQEEMWGENGCVHYLFFFN